MKKRNGCLTGCLSVIVLFLAILVLSYACSSGSQKNDQEKEWVAQLEQEKQEAEKLYSSNASPEDKAAQAREKMVKLEEEYTEIMDETGKNQTDYPLIRAYVDVREMYVAIKHIAENDEAEKYDTEYFQANGEAEQILRDEYDSY